MFYTFRSNSVLTEKGLFSAVFEMHNNLKRAVSRITHLIGL
jgi:hypothetical protein